MASETDVMNRIIPKMLKDYVVLLEESQALRIRTEQLEKEIISKASPGSMTFYTIGTTLFRIDGRSSGSPGKIDKLSDKIVNVPLPIKEELS